MYDTAANSSPITSVVIGSSTGFTRSTIKVSGNGQNAVELWYLIAPPTGLQTITVNFAGSLGTTDYIINAYSLYNVAQSNPIPNNATNTATGTSV
jgi:hypothetical protein